MDKNPISELQELCVQFKCAMPSYVFIQISQQPPIFRCNLNANNIDLHTEASSKKIAKTQAATLFLRTYKNSISPALANRAPQTPAGPYKPKSLIDDILQIDNLPKWSETASGVINPVGQLNEYCSKNCLPYPSYIESGMKLNEFIIICRHQGQCASGRGTTKKSAKQDAAFKMLATMNKVTTTEAETMIPVKEYEDTSMQQAVEKYDKATCPRQTSNTENIFECDLFKDLTIMSPSIKKEQNEPPCSVNNNTIYTKEIEELEKKLSSNNIKYNIVKLTSNPFFLSTAVQGLNFTECSDIYEEAKLKLLKTICKQLSL